MSKWRCRGVRGATTVEVNEREAILAATQEILSCVIQANGIEADDVASIIFSTTSDVNAAFPAVAARQLGWLDTALFCMHEMNVPNALPMCIRVLIHWNTTKTQKQVMNVYLREATKLRPDHVKPTLRPKQIDPMEAMVKVLEKSESKNGSYK